MARTASEIAHDFRVRTLVLEALDINLATFTFRVRCVKHGINGPMSTADLMAHVLLHREEDLEASELAYDRSRAARLKEYRP